MSGPHSNGIGDASATPRVLLIEDSSADAASVGDVLRQADARTRIYEAPTLLAGLDRLAADDIDLVLLDLGVRDNEGLDGLRAIRTYAPAVPVVVLVVTDQDSTPLRALQLGAEDWAVKSKIDAQRMARILHRLASKPDAAPEKAAGEPAARRAAVLGLLGSKGGIGTSTLACHLGLELERQAPGRVLLMDLDMTANSIAFLMNVPAQHTALEAANSIMHLDEARWHDMIARAPGGLQILPSGGPAGREDQHPKIERLRCLLRFIRPLYEWIVIDFGRLTPLAARLCPELTQVLLVTSLDPAALNATPGAARALQSAGMHRVRLAINRAPKVPELSQAELEKLVNLPVETMLPECQRQFKEAMSAEYRLGHSRQFSAQIATLASKLLGGGHEDNSRKLFGLFRLRA
jgi:pilus assembly protein CpaE